MDQTREWRPLALGLATVTGGPLRRPHYGISFLRHSQNRTAAARVSATRKILGQLSSRVATYEEDQKTVRGTVFPTTGQSFGCPNMISILLCCLVSVVRDPLARAMQARMRRLIPLSSSGFLNRSASWSTATRAPHKLFSRDTADWTVSSSCASLFNRSANLADRLIFLFSIGCVPYDPRPGSHLDHHCVWRSCFERQTIHHPGEPPAVAPPLPAAAKGLPRPVLLGASHLRLPLRLRKIMPLSTRWPSTPRPAMALRKQEDQATLQWPGVQEGASAAPSGHRSAR